MLTIVVSILVLFGLPFLHCLLLLKRACMNRGLDKKFPKKKSLLEKAEEEAKIEQKREEGKRTQIDKYLMFLQNPFAKILSKE
jgi:hypothetical protein